MNTEILTLIGSYGFPIIACIGMAWYVKYQTDQNREDLKKINDAHEKEMDKITEALNNNTIAIHDLTILIETLKGVKK